MNRFAVEHRRDGPDYVAILTEGDTSCASAVPDSRSLEKFMSCLQGTVWRLASSTLHRYSFANGGILDRA